MIDKTAVISSKAKIASGVTVGPYTIIGPDVEIDEGTKIGPHAVIEGPTKIGRNNKIFQFAAIGAEPQDKKYKGEASTLEVGDDNVFREFCTIHRGTEQGINKTVIGNGNLFMNYVHIAHDCIVGNETIFANNASLAGHVIVGNFAIISAFAKVVQFCSIGEYAFVAGATDILKDVPPFVLVSGYHDNVKTYGLNVIGLRRRGFSEETISVLKKAYNIIYRQDLTTQQAIPELEKLVPECKEVQLFIDVLKKSERGIVR